MDGRPLGRGRGVRCDGELNGVREDPRSRKWGGVGVLGREHSGKRNRGAEFCFGGNDRAVFASGGSCRVSFPKVGAYAIYIQPRFY